MSIRRMMLFTLGGSLVNTIIQNLKDFISLISPKGGITFEAESCSVTDLTTLQNINLLSSANFILLPNNSTEAEILPTLPVPTDTVRNLIYRSEGSTTNWSNNAVTTTFTATTNPLGGTTNIIRVTEVANTAGHSFSQAIPNLYAMRNDIFTFSTYLRKGDGAAAPDIMQLYYGTSFANFNINTGIVTFSGAVTSTSITNAGGGWWRCTISGGVDTTPSNNPNVFISFVNNNPSSTRAPSYLGATNRNVFVFGSQFELNLSATTYQRNFVHPRLPSGFASFGSTTFGNYWTNSLGNQQNTPYENLVWPSVRISSLSTGNNWRWVYAGLSFTFTGQVDPNGTFGASRIQLGAGTSRPDYFMTYQTSGTSAFNPSFPTSKIRTLILFVKQDSTDRYLGIRLSNGGNTGVYNSNADTIKVDCSNGTLANNPTNYTITYSSQSVGNGWYKVCINRVDAWDSMLFQSSSVLNTVNNNVGAGVLIWGVQVLDGVYNINTPTYQRELGYSIPRLDYSGGSTCPEYLIERSMYNSLLNSENFTAATWVTSALTVSANTEMAPNLELLADTLTATGSTASIRQSGTANNTTITPRIFSVFLKRKTGTGTVSIDMGTTSTNVTLTTTGWTRAFVVDATLSGTYTATTGNYTVTTSIPHGYLTGFAIYIDITSGGGIDASVNSITVTGPTTFTFSNGSATSSGNCLVYSNTGRINISTSGDEIYAWGSQIESSTVFTTSVGRVPSSYIPTTTSQVTRASDGLVTNFSGSSSCSLYFEMSKVGGSNNNTLNYLYIGNETSSGLATDGIGFAGTFNGVIIFSKKENNGAVTTVASLPYAITENKIFKTLLTISGTSLNLWMDGSLLSTTTFANPSLLDYITIEGSGGANTRLSQIISWPTTLTGQSIDLLFAYPYYNAGYTPINDELQQIINRAYAEGFTLPSSTKLGYCDTLITSMKNENMWNISDVFFNFAYNDTNLSNFARINWKNPYGGLGLAIYGGPTSYDANGIRITSTAGFVNTNFNPARASFNYKLNDASRLMVVTVYGNGFYLDGVPGQNLVNHFQSGNSTGTVKINSGTNLTSTNVNIIAQTGLVCVIRYDSTNITVVQRSTVQNTTQTSTVLFNDVQTISRNTNTSNNTYGCYFMGASLTTTQVANFRTFYNTFLTNNGLTATA